MEVAKKHLFLRKYGSARLEEVLKDLRWYLRGGDHFQPDSNLMEKPVSITRGSFGSTRDGINWLRNRDGRDVRQWATFATR